MKPLVVVEGDLRQFDSVVSELRRVGWQLTPGFNPPSASDRAVAQGTVATRADAAQAVLAALAGSGLLIRAIAEREVIDQLCGDLRHIGPLDHRLPGAGAGHAFLPPEHQQLLAFMLEGLTLGEAAKRLAISRRTADRRLAEIRDHYRVTSRSAALRAARRDFARPG